MKKNTVVILIVILLIATIAFIFLRIKKHQDEIKVSNKQRYLEIKESVNKAVEWNIKAQYPSCPISSEFDKDANAGKSYYDSSFLIDNGYLKKEDLLDIDKKSYCDIYVVIKVKYEDPLNHQINCSTSYKAYLKCNDYKDKGYIN